MEINSVNYLWKVKCYLKARMTNWRVRLFERSHSGVILACLLNWFDEWAASVAYEVLVWTFKHASKRDVNGPINEWRHMPSGTRGTCCAEKWCRRSLEVANSEWLTVTWHSATCIYQEIRFIHTLNSAICQSRSTRVEIHVPIRPIETS